MVNKLKLSVLVVGSGGREHALVQMCLRSPLTQRVIAAPGNGGMKAEVDCYGVAVEDIHGIVKLAQDQKINFVIVGPEVPLSLGLVDNLRKVGILAYGPNAQGAKLESSKAFCKDFLTRHRIPTAKYASFNEVAPAIKYLSAHPAPIVIKASGLAAGKGVVMAETREQAIGAVKSMLEGNAFGKSGHEIVIEEKLYGEEVSIHAIISGSDFVCLPASQDHKRLGEGDTGPNTGGMGAYAPSTRVTSKIQADIEAQIIRPTLNGFEADGIEFRGTLYAGLMLTSKGIRVLEFNVRFGDPETQALLPMITDDLLPVLVASAKGEVLPKKLGFKDGAAIVIVLAAAGYPGDYRKGDKVVLPDIVPEYTIIVHAGTELAEDGTVFTSGGRVLGVSSHAPSLQSAANLAYGVCDQVNFEGKYLRRDIGHRELH